MQKISNNPEPAVLVQKVLQLVEGDYAENGDGFYTISDFTDSLKPFDFTITGRRCGDILRRLGFLDRRRAAWGMRFYVNSALLTEAKKRIGGEK